MKTKSETNTAINSITGKTIQQMTWDEIHKISKPISRETFYEKLKSQTVK
jgi:hypothetical protein